VINTVEALGGTPERAISTGLVMINGLPPENRKKLALQIKEAAEIGDINAFEGGKLMAGARLEFLTESHFILAGVIGLVWSIITPGHP
jgi:hypothetical protein